MEAYVDGSALGDRVGFGVVVLQGGEVLKEMHGPVSPKFVAGTRQVAGELFAVGRLMQWLQKQGYNHVKVYFDYQGIESWATGQWRAKQDLTKRYAQFMRNCPVQVDFVKVKAHSGNKWNDRADFLAKKGAQEADHSGAKQTGTAASQSKTNQEETLKKIGLLTESLLLEHGLEPRFDGTYNSQFARVNLLKDDMIGGRIDIYHTAKKPLNPYLHSFVNKKLKQKATSALGAVLPNLARQLKLRR